MERQRASSRHRAHGYRPADREPNPANASGFCSSGGPEAARCWALQPRVLREQALALPEGLPKTISPRKLRGWSPMPSRGRYRSNYMALRPHSLLPLAT